MQSETVAHLEKPVLIRDGVAYSLCGDFAALIEGEAFFNNLRGQDINLVAAIMAARDATGGLKAVRQILPCALHRWHKLEFEAVQAMIERMIAVDDASFVRAIGQMWPSVTEETEEANRNLRFDLNSLAEGNEFFRGEAWLSLVCLEGPISLEKAWRAFPCALHWARPELNLTEARRLMTLPSVFLAVDGLDRGYQAASAKARQRFVERLVAVASEEEKQEFLFRALARKQCPGAAQA